MKIIKATDYGFRRVVRVVMNSSDPEAVHVDGKPHRDDLIPKETVELAAFRAEFGREPKSWEWCHECIYNWREPIVDKDGHPINSGGFTWTGDELLVGLNKWGNPTHDEQQVVSVRAKTWDELYQEIDDRLGKHVDFGDAPREAVPVLVPEVEPDFELIVAGKPYMEEGLVSLRCKVLRLGVPVITFIASGLGKDEFCLDRNAKYLQAQQEILELEQSLAQAQVIIS